MKNFNMTPISAGLDYYKPTMSHVEFLKYPEAEVTFTLINRGANRLADYVDADELRERLGRFVTGWQDFEIDFLSTHERRDGGALFRPEYLSYLRDSDLPPVDIEVSPTTSDLHIETTGAWPLSTFWETLIMSEMNELFFESYLKKHDIKKEDVFAEGDRRLDEKIAVLLSRPDVKFADFGTRRRFSYEWHAHVLDRLKSECPDNLIGTSNVYFARELNIMPIGTFAHEMPMVYAALDDEKGLNPLESQVRMLDDWQETYDDNLSTALTDTFGSEFFFANFSKKRARHWLALRHDSGDRIDYGEKVIDFYGANDIDPLTKTIVFSDGLNITKILENTDRFKNRIKTMSGWGTDLTNDVGLPANNIVMKATSANGVSTVKISDDIGKHTGDQDSVERYIYLAKTKKPGSYHEH